MTAELRPGEPLQAAVDAGYEQCLSCNACRSICTVHTASGRLPPLRLLRAAALGMRDELLASPDIWYCMQCNRCSQTCPMGVAPASLLRELRLEAVRCGLVTSDALRAWEQLLAGFQRVRWHMLAAGATGQKAVEMAQAWECWAREPIRQEASTIVVGKSVCSLRADLVQVLGFDVDLSACMTCGACSTVCPVTNDRAVFDPVVVFRMANLDQGEELMKSPTIWMCLGCGACAEACTQQVPGHLVLRGLQDVAMVRGVVSAQMRAQLSEIERALYPKQVAAVDDWWQRFRDLQS